MRHNVSRAVIGCVLIGSVAVAQEPSASKLVAEGNQALAAGDPVKAAHLYNQAAELKPDNPEIAYNRGVAKYRNGEFEKATEHFREALATRDLTLDAKARYNLGNCAYSQALKQQAELPAAIDKLKEAIAYYREALEVDPKDRSARANIERAQLLMKHLMDQEKQRQEQQKQQGDQDQQNEEEDQQDQQPQSQPSSQPGEQQPKQDEQQQGDKDKQQESASKEQQEKGEQSEQQQAQQEQQGEPGDEELKAADEQSQQGQQGEQAGEPRQAQAKPMSREEAERLLQAVRDKERQRREEQADREARFLMPVPVERDW